MLRTADYAQRSPQQRSFPCLNGFPFLNPQHGARRRRRVDCIGRMVMRSSDWEIASQSALDSRRLHFASTAFDI